MMEGGDETENSRVNTNISKPPLDRRLNVPKATPAGAPL